MGIKVNWDEGGGGEFNPLPEDKYVVRISDASIFETASGPNKGAQNMKVEATVMEGEWKNRKLWRNFSFLPQSRGFLKDFMQVITGETLSGDGEFELWEIIGKTAMVYVTIVGQKDKQGNAVLDAEGNPKLTNEIQTWLPYDPDNPSTGFKGF